MARIFPPEITEADVQRALDEVAARHAYSDDGWATATVDLDAIGVSVTVLVGGGAYDAECRERVAATVRLLPALHARVAEVFGAGGPSDGSDDHHLGVVDVEADRVVLGYNCSSHNSTWTQTFRVGGWPGQRLLAPVPLASTEPPNLAPQRTPARRGAWWSVVWFSSAGRFAELCR